MDITIVYLNYLMKRDLLQSLESLLCDLANCPYAVAVVVADNSGNRDGIRYALRQQFPSVQYVDCGGNVGFGRGNTIGFQHVSARYYFALNCDTLIPHGSRTIERIIRFMDEHPRIGCIGPKLINSDGSVQSSRYRFDWRALMVKPFRHLGWDKKYRWAKRQADRLQMNDVDSESTRPVDWVLGAALVVRREVVEQVGWFDPRYFMYMEDADWCRAMWAGGWPVYYVHDIAIVHRHERGSAAVPGLFRALLKNSLTRMHARSWLQFLWKWRNQFHRYAP